MHAPEVTDYVKQQASKVEAVGDDIEAVNKLKGAIKYDDASRFDQEKEKANFRKYEEACDRVKGFYAVSPVVSDKDSQADLACRSNTRNRLSSTISKSETRTPRPSMQG